MKLVIGTIVYNESSARYLPDFLPSLKRALEFLPAADYQVHIFDNSDRHDNQNQKIIEAFMASGSTFPFIYEGGGKNLGFARPYNRMINRAAVSGAQYFLVINPDTLIEPDAIRLLVAKLDEEPSLAAVSPKLLHWDFIKKEKTRVIDSCGLALGRGLRFYDLGQGKEDEETFYRQPIIGPSGAAGLFRLSALEKAKEKEASQDGGAQYFDEHFFIYKEDCDLAYRLYLAGLKSGLVSEAVIYHDRTAAASGSGFWLGLRERRGKSRAVRAWSFRNQYFLFRKYFKKQNFVNKMIILAKASSMLFFSLILEQFLLKEYQYILYPKRVLTNIK